jgi:hypothetical protein
MRQLMVRLNWTKIFVAVAITFLVLSVTMGVASIYSVGTDKNESKVLINDTFHLSPNEVRRQGIGNFHGNQTIGGNETLIAKVVSSDVFVKNFSIVTYSGTQYNVSTSKNITYAFVAGADYYEAIITSNQTHTGTVHFQVDITRPQLVYSLAWLSAPAKILFLFSLSAFILALLTEGILKKTSKSDQPKVSLPSMSKTDRRLLMTLLALSLAVWLVVLVINNNPFGTYENWYTDHVRHSYVSSLFLKYGLSVFDQPLDVLASHDSSAFMFVTWPEMPHLYPIGSILLFLPFGALLQSGVNAVLVYKLEIGSFLVFAHASLYFVLSIFWVQTSLPSMTLKNAKKNLKILNQNDWKQKAPLIREYFDLGLKLIGVYIIYTSLVTFAADGMFDAVAFFFSMLAVTMFLTDRYDKFLLLVGVSILFKYQSGIFMFPLIIVGIVKLLENSNLIGIIKNKAVILAVLFAAASGFTAYLSAPYLIATRPELVMNGVNAFSPHAQIQWPLQASAVLLTLGATIVYAVYMLNKNKLLSFSAVFLLLPTFTLPYFQNWYLPYMFVYALIPQKKNELEATIIWLIFMMIVLSFGGSAFDPRILTEHFQTMIKMIILSLGF